MTAKLVTPTTNADALTVAAELAAHGLPTPGHSLNIQDGRLFYLVDIFDIRRVAAVLQAPVDSQTVYHGRRHHSAEATICGVPVRVAAVTPEAIAVPA